MVKVKGFMALTVTIPFIETVVDTTAAQVTYAIYLLCVATHFTTRESAPLSLSTFHVSIQAPRKP